MAQLLHLSTLGGVLAAVARHFRYTPAALPLLAQPLSNLRIGTFVAGTHPAGGVGHETCVRQNHKLTISLTLHDDSNLSFPYNGNEITRFDTDLCTHQMIDNQDGDYSEYR